mgnify:FL=1
MATQREQSKKDWESRDTSEDLQLGCLQRIADATEKMASNYQRMENDLAMYKRWYKEKCETVNNRDRSISNLRGQITKLKKKLSVIAGS